MPTAKELNLQKGEVVGMTSFGSPKRYGDGAIGLRMEQVKAEIVDVDDEYQNIFVKYLGKSDISGAEEGDIQKIINPKYCGFYRLTD